VSRRSSVIYGLYASPDSAQRAYDRLRAAGIADDLITVISSEPFEEYAFSHRHEATWLYWIAGLGGLIGLTLGFGITFGTSRAWPIQTGDMPIVALWPNTIVMFECTMLGAILATVITLFLTAKLPSREPRLYDPDVSYGAVLVGIEDPPQDLLGIIEETLRATGGRVKTDLLTA
jgi:Alternative complex III, ActD subunit